MANSNLLVEKRAEVDSLLSDLDTITQLSSTFLDGLADPTFTSLRPATQIKAEFDAIRTMLAQLQARARELGHAGLEKQQSSANAAEKTKRSGKGGEEDDDEDVKIGLEALGGEPDTKRTAESSIFELSRGKASGVQALFSWKALFRQNAHVAANT